MTTKQTLTGSNDQAAYFEDGVQVYPCRCGTTHRGAYACEDWNHHNCFHDAELLMFAEYQAVCTLCGASFATTYYRGAYDDH